MLQTALTIIIVAIAVAYAGYSIRRVLNNADGRCYGCPIKDACSKKNTTRTCLTGGKDIQKQEKSTKKVHDDEKN